MHSKRISLCVTAFLGIAAAQTITVDTSRPVNTFSPFRALGAGVDRLETGSPDHFLTGPILQKVLDAGWQPVTYRQNTELHAEAWHWNPRGVWRNPEKQEGYFT